MTELDERFKSRCPRRIESLPKGWCPLAVMRLKAIRALGKAPSDEEEQVLPGCPWAIDNQMANYCWYVFEAKRLNEGLSDTEIAANLGLSVDEVKKTAASALQKLQKSSFVGDLRESHGDEPVLEESGPEGFSYHE